VFMNLLVNAGQAITEHGTITLKTWEDGGLVHVMVRDTGCGIPGDLLGRIFDPFFTTKPVGTGTGLGLSLAWGIVHDHGGRIDVDSTVGIGTTFTVILPVAGLAGATAD
jgi:two-component system NtrC family sensor kinase